MLLVVASHYVLNSGLIAYIDAQPELRFTDYFLLLFGWGGKIGINCFVLITGYFMCSSHITGRKFFRLVGEECFYKATVWCFFFFIGYVTFSLPSFLGMLFPFSFVGDNFTGCFFLFYLLIPFLNRLVHALTEKEHFWLMMWCVGVYVVLPSFAKATVVFNYITWFCILYVIASYIRLYPKDWFSNTKVTGILAAASLMLSLGSVAALAAHNKMVEKSVGLAYFYVLDSNKILALTTAVSAFLFFKNIKMGYSKVINTVAASTFGVLLLHTGSDTMRQWLWVDVCNNVGVYQADDHVVLHAVFCVIAVYAVCTLIDMVRIGLIKGTTAISGGAKKAK